MKTNNLLFSILLSILFTGVISCNKDPYYTPPGSIFSGRLVYNGIPIGVANNGQGGNIAGKANNSVYFQLTQPGYALNAPVSVVVNEDGSFSDLLFNGNYKLTFPTGILPFIPANADSMPVTINGNLKMDINVIPYYAINNATFKLSAADSLVSAAVGLTQVLTGANARGLERVSLYISRTSFVDDGANAAVISTAGSGIGDLSNIQLSLKVPANLRTSGAVGAASQDYVFVRVGVKMINIPQLLYSNIQQLSFQ